MDRSSDSNGEGRWRGVRRKENRDNWSRREREKTNFQERPGIRYSWRTIERQAEQNWSEATRLTQLLVPITPSVGSKEEKITSKDMFWVKRDNFKAGETISLLSRETFPRSIGKKLHLLTHTSVR